MSERAEYWHKVFGSFGSTKKREKKTTYSYAKQTCHDIVALSATSRPSHRSLLTTRSLRFAIHTVITSKAKAFVDRYGYIQYQEKWKLLPDDGVMVSLQCVADDVVVSSISFESPFALSDQYHHYFSSVNRCVRGRGPIWGGGVVSVYMCHHNVPLDSSRRHWILAFMVWCSSPGVFVCTERVSTTQFHAPKINNWTWNNSRRSAWSLDPFNNSSMGE